MAVSFGIVGFPNVGKSTLFNLLTGSSVKVSNYPFCTTDHHDGMVGVPDERLEKLRSILEPKECIPAAIRTVDIAGLVEGASRGEGLGNQFLAHIREVDVILHVLRGFAAEDIAHITGKVDPASDFAAVNTELVLADLEAVERRIEKLKGKAQSGDKEAVNENSLLEHARSRLDEGKLLIGESFAVDLSDGSEVDLLSTKPQLVVVNCDDYGAELPDLPGFPIVGVPVTMEAEMAEMSADERTDFLDGMERKALAIDEMIGKAYEALGLITFYTTANEILQAWPILNGTTASKAAGKVHSDMEEKFVRASVVGCDDMVECGSILEARSKGVAKTEGRDYVVTDGDIMEFAF